MDTSDLANRMKEYEKRNQYYLQKKTPVIIRVDGRSFHTFTKGFKRPFDKVFMKSMQETAKYMCENIQGAKLAYVQSDEITIILVDYDTIETDCWFNYRTDKLCSIAASMATMKFNRVFLNAINDYCKFDENATFEQRNAYIEAAERGAMFDARCFNIPKEEVCNCLIWRQQDATRNSIQSVGQHYFSHTQLQNKTCDDIQDMLWKDCNINWNDYSTTEKRGSCCIKKLKDIGINYNYSTKESTPIRRMSWTIDNEIPIFTQNREYIENLINFN